MTMFPEHTHILLLGSLDLVPATVCSRTLGITKEIDLVASQVSCC